MEQMRYMFSYSLSICSVDYQPTLVNDNAAFRLKRGDSGTRSDGFFGVATDRLALKFVCRNI